MKDAPGVPKNKIPKWVPWSIAGVALAYFLAAAVVSALLLRGNDSIQVRALARWLPVPVARVGGQLVWAREYLDYRAFIETFMARTNQSTDVITTESPLGRQVITLLVSNKVLERAAKEEGVSVTEAEVNDAYDDILVAQGGNAPREVTQEELRTILNELYGSTQAQLHGLIRIQLLEDKVRSSVIEQVRFRHILVRDEARAREVLEQLKGGGDFTALAHEFSEHLESRDNGGDMGFVSRGQQSEAMERALFTNSLGLIGESVQSEFGFHLVELLERKGTAQQTFDAWLADAKAKYHASVYLRV
ncbi:MAG: peptidylprolyl isomerase [Patescibacteria group bacterium]|jgi:hypothetical protein